MSGSADRSGCQHGICACKATQRIRGQPESLANNREGRTRLLLPVLQHVAGVLYDGCNVANGAALVSLLNHVGAMLFSKPPDNRKREGD